MDEKIETEPANVNTDKGDIPETATLIERANDAAKRLEEANKKREELLKREEEIEARRALGGRSELTVKSLPKTEEELYVERAKKRYAGTGLDPTKH